MAKKKYNKNGSIILTDIKLMSNPDENTNTYVYPGMFEKINEIEFKDHSYPVLWDGGHDVSDLVGEAKIRKEGDFLVADITLLRDPINSVCGIAGTVIERHGKVIDKMELTSVSLLLNAGPHSLSLIHQITEIEKPDGKTYRFKENPDL